MDECLSIVYLFPCRLYNEGLSSQGVCVFILRQQAVIYHVLSIPYWDKGRQVVSPGCQKLVTNV
jgi:hypothetical protein